MSILRKYISDRKQQVQRPRGRGVLVDLPVDLILASLISTCVSALEVSEKNAWVFAAKQEWSEGWNGSQFLPFFMPSLFSQHRPGLEAG